MHQVASTRRGRGLGSGLVLLLGALTGCGDRGPPPGEPLPDYREPSVTEQGGWTLIESPDPAERLLIYDDPPVEGLQLLFMGGRAAAPLRDGGAAWPDADGAQILVFDDRGVVARVAQREPYPTTATSRAPSPSLSTASRCSPWRPTGWDSASPTTDPGSGSPTA